MQWVHRFQSWLCPAEPETPDQVIRKLATKCNMEIAARLVRRAEVHEEHGGYPARCSPMDRIAADRIRDLERQLALAENRDPSVGDRDFDRMLMILRAPNK
jgi:hypothetical protein